MTPMDFFRYVSRADVLLGQSRYAQAEHLLEAVLSQGIENTEILKMTALAKLGLHKYAEAEKICRLIIDRNPNEAFAFYLLANIRSTERQFDIAQNMIDNAIQLEPANPDFHAYKANLYQRTKDYNEALESADVALSLDAENISALNARATALVGLGRREEAYQTIDKSLAADPNNSDTHANLAWGLLHHGESATSLEHFKTALKIDPTNEYAKMGMIEALKAKFPLYRYFLVAMLWLNKLKEKNQWALIIGSYLVLRVLSYIAQTYESLTPYLAPLIVMIVVFFISTWIFSPLMNLYLLSNPFGRYTLSDEQKKSARLVGISLAISLCSLAIFLFIYQHDALLSLAVFSFLLMIPFGSMYNPITKENKNKLVVYTLILIVLVCLGVMMSFLSNTVENPLTYLTAIGFIGYQWYTNYLLARE